MDGISENRNILEYRNGGGCVAVAFSPAVAATDDNDDALTISEAHVINMRWIVCSPHQKSNTGN